MSAAVAAIAAAALAWWAWERAHRRTHPVPAGHRPEINVPYEQEFELYHNALSLCSMKVRVCMAELRIPYESHHIDLIETSAYGNIRRRFLAINPGGTVPVLVHRGHPVYESHEQIRYAADHAPAGSPRLVPEDLALREHMQRWIDRSSLTGDPLNEGDQSAANAVPGLTLPLFAAMIDRIPAWKILEGALFHFDRRRPFMFLTFKLVGLQRFGTLTPAMHVLSRSRRQLHAHLDALEHRLRERRGPWILGEMFSLADVSWLVIFERLVQADALHVFVDPAERPECAAYWRRLQARPSYREAILDHAHPTVVRGTARLQEAKAARAALRTALEGDHTGAEARGLPTDSTAGRATPERAVPSGRASH
jgi:glutathione S-transferase